MTPEQALFLQLMLSVGITDPFDRWFEEALAQPEYHEPLLEIALHPSDPTKVIADLGAYRGTVPLPDGQAAFELVRAELQRLYDHGMPVDRLCSIMRTIAEQTESVFPEPMNASMDVLDLLHDEAEDGLLDRDHFMEILENFLYRGVSVYANWPYTPAPDPSRWAMFKSWLRRLLP